MDALIRYIKIEAGHGVRQPWVPLEALEALEPDGRAPLREGNLREIGRASRSSAPLSYWVWRLHAPQIRTSFSFLGRPHFRKAGYRFVDELAAARMLAFMRDE